MVAVIFERRPTYGGMGEFLHDVFRWSTVIGVIALGEGMAAAGQAFRGNGFDEIVFGPAALLLLAVAAVALPRALRTAESDFTVPYFEAMPSLPELTATSEWSGGCSGPWRWSPTWGWPGCDSAYSSRQPPGNLREPQEAPPTQRGSGILRCVEADDPPVQLSSGRGAASVETSFRCAISAPGEREVTRTPLAKELEYRNLAGPAFAHGCRASPGLALIPHRSRRPERDDCPLGRVGERDDGMCSSSCRAIPCIRDVPMSILPRRLRLLASLGME